ncbi:hypothetical protein M569_13116, partial [Genlisea aurea]
AGDSQANSTGHSRVPPVSGLGGGGLGVTRLEPDNSSSLSQLLQNPAVTQMMQSFLSNPQYINQVLALNPQLQSMLDVNPQLREMMQNPEFLREMTSPATMQQMLALQQQLSQLGRRQSPLDEAQGDRGSQNNNAGLELLMNMFGGLGAGTLIPNAPPNASPEEIYATQLSQLQEMGFFDVQENIRALRATAGNVHAAVERLLGN